MIFARGTVVHHKVMGKGTAINEVEEKGEKMVEVRMENGHIEKFYPEELESDDTVQARNRAKVAEANRANEARREAMKNRYGF